MNTADVIEPTLVHEDVASDPPGVERKFFVANLGYDIGESDLYSFFSSYGKVETVRLILDRNTGASRGFGFITMHSDVGALAVADLAEENNNTITMMGRSGVHIAVHDKERQIKKAEERRQMMYGSGGGGGGFGPYGGGSFMPPYHHHHHNHPGNHPGIGMPPPAPYGGFQPSVSMQPHHARTQMPPPPPPPLSSYAPVPPAWHKMRVSINGGAGGPELLIEEIPNNCSIDDLVAKFSSYGTVVGASLRQSVGAGSGRSSYARVRFSNPASLAAAITGHMPTAPPPHQYQSQNHNQLRSLREPNTATGNTTAAAGSSDYGLWRPHPKTVKTVPTPASAPTPTLRADSIEGSLSTWSSGTAGPFTPPRVGRSGPRPPGF